MRVLQSRVDAFTIAARVRLSPELVARLRAAGEKAAKHGRCSFQWATEEGVIALSPGEAERRKARRLGVFRASSASAHAVTVRRDRIYGELGRSEVRGTYHITNEPVFRLLIKERAPGGGEPSTCGACGGLGWCGASILCPSLVDAAREECVHCHGEGVLESPGFTCELVWYAQELARIGLEEALAESEAIFGLLGEVLELRTRRVDLCADVEGWEVSDTDVQRIAKRSRADLGVWDGEAQSPEVAEAWDLGRRLPAPKSVKTHFAGGSLRLCTTGISVGMGGAIASRIYNKVVELEHDGSASGQEKREREEARWRAAGWKGEAPVARVEFQLRTEALKEMGLLDPHAAKVPLFETDVTRGKDGRERVRVRFVGTKLLTVQTDEGERPATLLDRLDAMWRTCLEWVRLVVPEHTRSGRPVQVSRLKDDPRWELLREVKFNERPSLPIQRVRPRAAASSAQALGVMLSQAARDGRLRELLSEDVEEYARDPHAESKLRARIVALANHTAWLIFNELVVRWGGVAQACEHFAIRHNAKLLRFRREDTSTVHVEARPPPSASGTAILPAGYRPRPAAVVESMGNLFKVA